MKLLCPILPSGGRDHIRVIEVCRWTTTFRQHSRRLAAMCGMFETYPDRKVEEYLDLVDLPRRKVVMICNAAASADNPRSLRRAIELILAGEIDLVAMTDLSSVSRSLEESLDFVRHCADQGTRVISFLEGIDSGDSDWEQRIFEAYIDPPTSASAAEGGAA